MSKNLKIKKGDKVAVIAGKDKGKIGVVSLVMPKVLKVVVEGINVSVKHQKPSQALPQGGKFAKEMPIHYSNIQIVDPKTDLPSKIGFKILSDGNKVRFARRSAEIIDNK